MSDRSGAQPHASLPSRTSAVLALAGLISALAGCASVPSAPAPTAAPPAATSAMPSAAGASSVASRTAGGASAPGAGPGAAAAPRPFAEVVAGATRTDGYLPLWRNGDRLWLEIGPDQLDKPFFLSVNMSRGIGERMLLGGLMGSSNWGTGGEYVAQFRRAAGNVQLLARNQFYTATAGSPEERAVRFSFSDSLLASAPLASAPHPERRSVLVDVSALLMSDIPRASNTIEKAYRNQFAFDARNSFVQSAKSDAARTVIDVTAHYAQPRIPVPPPTVPGAPPQPFFPPPAVLEDPRSLFLGFLYNFAPLPAEPMAPRLADSRVGHFATPKLTFSDESRFSPVRWYVQRWRLEKTDPQAALSPPKKPIRFVLGNEIPVKYREPIRLGILEWNKAFEKVGFQGALEVAQQSDDSDDDLLDVKYSSVRWMTTATPSFGAIGPSQVDPRSGEILDADIGWDANVVRNIRALRSEGVIASTAMYDASGELAAGATGAGSAFGGRFCNHANLAARELGFAFALLDARGDFDPDGPEAEKLVFDFLKDVMMHEVGHTLGLRHNFRASTTIRIDQLGDRARAEREGLTGSVMEYTPFNIALRGERQGVYSTPTLGPYDYWAIEYAYKPIASGQEAAELARIAARSNEPGLAFATDEDVGVAFDPYVNQSDLGNDPLAWWRRRIALTQELWQRLEQRQLPAGETYTQLRRRFLLGITQIGQATATAAKFVGGSQVLEDQAGSPRLPVTPVEPAKQREALALIADGLLRRDSIRVSPDFIRRLHMERLERDVAVYGFTDTNVPGGSTYELNLPERILAHQRDVLNRLMSPVVARRLVEDRTRTAQPFALSELYATLQRAIWEEARTGAESDVLRRNLQREHLRRVVAALVGSSAPFPADARALLRQDARELRDQLAAASRKGGLSAESRAHYAESAESLDDALKARLVKTGV